MRVLLTGAGGQLGRDLHREFGSETVIGLSHELLDITDERAVVTAVAHHRPDLVINAAAWTDVDGCEADEDRAHLHNAVGPWWLARACAAHGSSLVHISTDYVFSGDAPIGSDGMPRGWSEFDGIDPINAYGRAKAAGEQLVRESLERHHIVRTSWLNGAGTRSFVHKMLQLAHERDRIEVVDDQFGNPTFTHDLARSVRELVATGNYGTINRTNQGHCSWFDLASAVLDCAGAKTDLVRTTSDRLARPAPRPAWSVLDDRHARTQGLAELPHWRESLRTLLGEIGALESQR